MIRYHGSAAKERLQEAILKARQFPRKSEARYSFLRSLKGLNAIKGKGGTIIIHWDFVPASFCWEACGLFGGFIFHSRSQEWSIHT